MNDRLYKLEVLYSSLCALFRDEEPEEHFILELMEKLIEKEEQKYGDT